MVVRILSILCLLVVAGAAQAADFRVTFINPGEENGFWGEVSKTMEAAAEDLNVDLEVLYANRKPYAMEELLQQRVERGDLPDYFVLVNENQAAARLMQLLDGKPSKVLFLLSKLTLKQRRILERRNIDLRGIVASIVPDNEIAGYEMAQSLIDTARLLNPDRKEIRLLALTGDTTTALGLERELGMMRAIADNPDVKLVHAIPVQWNEDLAYARTGSVLSRTNVDVIWSASDAISFGAQRAAVDAGLVPGKDVLFSGLGWSRRAMEAVREKKMTMTYGGHALSGAWAIVMLRDHFFKSFENALFIDVLFKMSPITTENVETYLTGLGDGDWTKIDFGQFSKAVTGRNHYDFSAKALLKAVGS